MAGDDGDAEESWFDFEPYGDQVCQCPCGHRVELMPEDADLCHECQPGGRHWPPPDPGR